MKTKSSLALLSVPIISNAGVTLIDEEDFSASIGARIQPRLEITDVAILGDTDKQSDFMVRRTRLKLNGHALEIKYKFEWKLDNVNQIGKMTTAQVENSYLEYQLDNNNSIKMGLYDAPFSRDALTSDSKQLAVDRGKIYSNVSGLGVADNVVGVNFKRKLNDGGIVYQIGVFDNLKISGEQQNSPLFIGRFDVNLGSTKNIFRDAHFGTDEWISFGFGAAYQSNIHDQGNSVNEGELHAYGFDWIYDGLVGQNRLMIRGEVNRLSEKQFGSIIQNEWTDWMLGMGYLISEKYQPFIRVDTSNMNTITETQYLIGFNYYMKQHNLKVQTDILKKSPEVSDYFDQFRIQIQLDF